MPAFLTRLSFIITSIEGWLNHPLRNEDQARMEDRYDLTRALQSQRLLSLPQQPGRRGLSPDGRLRVPDRGIPVPEPPARHRVYGLELLPVDGRRVRLVLYQRVARRPAQWQDDPVG